VNSESFKTPIAAVLIAAGESSRLKKFIKQLIPWKGQPLIAYILNVILGSGLSPIHVILGAHSNRIMPVIENFPIKIIRNPDWREGKGTSISLGIQSLPENVSAAMIFVVDQPFLSTELIHTILKEFRTNQDVEIIAPFYRKIQSNPVLFTKKVFPDLIKLQNESGGKDIIGKYAVKKIQWNDKRILIDIDTLEDYEAALSCSNLPD